jgi:hypothetical protein
MTLPPPLPCPPSLSCRPDAAQPRTSADGKPAAGAQPGSRPHPAGAAKPGKPQGAAAAAAAAGGEPGPGNGLVAVSDEDMLASARPATSKIKSAIQQPKRVSGAEGSGPGRTRCWGASWMAPLPPPLVLPALAGALLQQGQCAWCSRIGSQGCRRGLCDVVAANGKSRSCCPCLDPACSRAVLPPADAFPTAPPGLQPLPTTPLPRPPLAGAHAADD